MDAVSTAEKQHKSELGKAMAAIKVNVNLAYIATEFDDVMKIAIFKLVYRCQYINIWTGLEGKGRKGKERDCGRDCGREGKGGGKGKVGGSKITVR